MTRKIFILFLTLSDSERRQFVDQKVNGAIFQFQDPDASLRGEVASLRNEVATLKEALTAQMQVFSDERKKWEHEVRSTLTSRNVGANDMSGENVVRGIIYSRFSDIKKQNKHLGVLWFLRTTLKCWDT